MKVEIWSDVVCPFCYIGKRRYEEALEKSGFKNEVVTEWKSFQLNPDLKSDGTKSLNEHLSEIKGWTLEHATKMNLQVSAMAAESGLIYNLDKAIVANTADAHRLIQFAKSKGLGNEMEEKLFAAYFTEGKDIADHNTLALIASETGLDKEECLEILNSAQYSEEVEFDAYEASQLGIRSVPFFVFDRKYGISGAQPAEVFERTLEQCRTEALQS